MRFFSDNAASVHPAVLEAVMAANAPDTAYDGDAISARLDTAFSDLFETKVSALWVATGTAANCLALAALCPPYRGTLCANDAHINQDEAGAPEFFSGGGKLITVDAPGSKLTPALAEARLDMIANDVHRTQAAALSITNATEYGLSYTAAEVGALGELAKAKKLRFHMDGARFANAVVHGGASPADLTWRAGVEALSFGFVKNGGLSCEALILFDRDLAEEVKNPPQARRPSQFERAVPRRTIARAARRRFVADQRPRFERRGTAPRPSCGRPSVIPSPGQRIVPANVSERSRRSARARLPIL